jgi:hypothetical protein
LRRFILELREKHAAMALDMFALATEHRRSS